VCLEDQWKGNEAVKKRGLLIAAVKRNGGSEYKDLLRISVEKMQKVMHKDTCRASVKEK
jgi:hypothetical protein